AFAGGPPLASLPGVVTADGRGAPPLLVPDLAAHPPARRLARRRRRYFIGELDPCASIEFTRGCPWDCAFCSAWTFYGRSYRMLSPEAAVEDLARIREPNVFIVDDVAFIRPEHGLAIADAVERRGIRKRYYLETRADVLLRNREVFARWTRLGLRYMFLGIEAIDEEGLRPGHRSWSLGSAAPAEAGPRLHRRRVHVDQTRRPREPARDRGRGGATNIGADRGGDGRRSAAGREGPLAVPEIVNMTIN